MATLFTGRTTPTASPATQRSNIDDLGAGLDYDGALMTDENGDVIIFHTGTYGPSESLFTGRIIP